MRRTGLVGLFESSEREWSAPGAGVLQEYARTQATRARAVRVKHPHIGGLILALSGDPAHAGRWARGRVGEEHVGKALAAHLRPDAIVLYDRRIPNRSANIDHLIVVPSGVWVIDSTRLKGRVIVTEPLAKSAKLKIAGRDKTVLVRQLELQVDYVEAQVSRIAPDVLVRGALCFLDPDLPLRGAPPLNGYPLLYPRWLAKLINAPGPLDPDGITAVAWSLARRFPAQRALPDD